MSWPAAGLAFAGGILFWTLFEYAGHRWVMHGSGMNFLKREHQQHHQEPANQSLVGSLIYGSVAVGLVGIGGWLATAAISVLMAPLTVGFAVGLLTYICAHQVTHRVHVGGRHSLMPLSWRDHLRHHSGRSNNNFGFTTTIWDRVFRTYR